LADRSAFYQDLAKQFYGANRPGAKVSQGTLDQFWRLSMQAGVVGAYDCVKAFSETDFTTDLKKIDVPLLVIHGDDDQIVPLALTSERTAKMVKNATLKVYPGAPHGLMVTHRRVFHDDLLAFAKQQPQEMGEKRRDAVSAMRERESRPTAP
jgi:non-heme chloroperoxidase